MPINDYRIRLGKLDLFNIFKNEKISIFMITVVSIISFMKLMESNGLLNKFDDKFARPFEFQFREYMGMDPDISNDFIFVTFDNPSVSKMKTTRLNVNQWFDTLSTLESMNPKAIILNQYFELPLGIFEFDDQEKYKFPNTYIPVSSIIEERQKTKGGKESISSQYLEKKLTMGKTVLQINTPHKKIIDKFGGFGTTNYSANGTINASIKIKDGHGLFHIGLKSLKANEISEGVYDLNNYALTKDTNTLSVNFISRKKMNKFVGSRNLSLEKIQDQRWQKTLAKVIPGKVIYIDAINEGSPDGRLDSPIGEVMASHVLSSLINSSITGSWIQTVSVPSIFLFIAIALASLIVLNFSTAVSSIATVTIAGSLTYTGLYLFAYKGIRFDWINLAGYWTLSSFITLGLSLVRKEINAKKVKRALSGIMPKDQISKIASNPAVLNTKAQEKNITVMFIDIIGFSLVSETTRPDVAFSSLKDTLTGITKIIHKYGGVVDKTLGDGVLCFFGGGLVTTEEKFAHAQKAVECAREIQQYSVERVLISEVRSIPPFPVRIGINTSEVFVGNIGNEERYDFTIIGSGVNFAQRLEAACEPFKILVGTGTLVNLEDEFKESFQKRLINIKHHSELIEAYEYDPFIGKSDLIDKADEIMREFHNISRTEERIPLPSELDFKMVTEDGSEFKITNFSQNGFAATSEDFFGKKVRISAKVEINSERIESLIEHLGMNPLTVEICWGRVIGEGRYLHGLRITSLNNTQKEKLFLEMKNELIDFSSHDLSA